MNAHYKKSLFLFRRDLRLEDNTGLLALLEQSEQVIAAFIFDDRQTDPNTNPYFSAPSFSFLLTSLKELNQELKKHSSELYVFSGDPKKILESLLRQDKVEAVFVNKDYTPFSRQRDDELATVCRTHQVVFQQHTDIPLSPIENIQTNTGAIYTVFTPFLKKAGEYPISIPKKNKFSNYCSHPLKTKTVSLENITVSIGERRLKLEGGRAEALRILHEHTYLKNYNDARNFPAIHGTSTLSPHHKFGTISIRESYHTAIKHSSSDTQYISELYWRDFYYYIAHHFPSIFQKPFLGWAEYIKWTDNAHHFEAWCQGKTGVPIVDAGMRELNQTGWMHNRTRMIVASYLTKNLLIDWKWGEKYFAQNLLDYDPAQNNGGWQWSASTGADPRPLRIFNPYLQAQKYDPHAEYIQHWVPELKGVDKKLLTNGKESDFSTLVSSYSPPLVNQKESYRLAVNAYTKAKIDFELAQKNK